MPPEGDDDSVHAASVKIGAGEDSNPSQNEMPGWSGHPRHAEFHRVTALNSINALLPGLH